MNETDFAYLLFSFILKNKFFLKKKKKEKLIIF